MTSNACCRPTHNDKNVRTTVFHNYRTPGLFSEKFFIKSVENDKIFQKCISDYSTPKTKKIPTTLLRRLSSKRLKYCLTKIDLINLTNDILQWKSALNAGGCWKWFIRYDKRSQLLAKFKLKMFEPFALTQARGSVWLSRSARNLIAAAVRQWRPAHGGTQ